MMNILWASFRKFIALFLLSICLSFLLLAKALPSSESNYEIGYQSPFNQPSFYPIQQSVNPNLYLPTATWVGRLILPTTEQIQEVSGDPLLSDWVWIQVYHAPVAEADLVGKVIRLSWSQNPRLQAYRNLVTTNIKFSSDAVTNSQNGIVTPTRLNNRSQVGPLQSLAGARPHDDVTIGLTKVKVTTDKTGSPLLQTEQFPLQVTGRYYGLVKIEGPDTTVQSIPPSCPGTKPCPNQFFRVRHYNPLSKKFDGAAETILVPQQPPLNDERFSSTPRELEKSPAGQAGWYIYGAQDEKGVFVVQALKPRSLFLLKPDQIILGQAATLNYLEAQQWQDTPQLKGTVQKVLLDPTDTEVGKAEAQWQEGDRGLVLHLFGGIGGKKGEGTAFGSVTGHFSFGLAEVVRDPFTKELQFEINYEQTYAHNREGIIAGWQTWSTFMGNLQRGWLATRPVSDIIVKLDAITTDYNFNGVRLNPLEELLIQLEVISARYRTGDGTGISLVTPSTSCVQDSNQALYIAIQQFQHKLQGTFFQKWRAEHPNSPETRYFSQLEGLGRDLIAKLTPQGVVRPDWQENAAVLAGALPGTRFVRDQSWETALKSWRSMLPRRAHDEISRIFLEHGAQLWVIRTNQVGGWNPEIIPLAPTLLFGDIPLLSVVLRRILAAILTFPTLRDWLIGLGILAVYAAIAFPVGFKSGFLNWSPDFKHPKQLLLGIGITFFTPALIEELVFRVVLLPNPVERTSWLNILGWTIFSLVAFILYHPLNAKTFYRRGDFTFFKPIFLSLAGLLGLACSVAYLLTGSLYIIVIIHWVVVINWLFIWGGQEHLKLKSSK
jgi:predicted Abi (CAAX) family protease